MTALGSGLYTIQNLQYKSYASVPPGAGFHSEVTANSEPRVWNIVESKISGQYVCDMQSDLGDLLFCSSALIFRIHAAVGGSDGIWNLADSQSNVSSAWSL